jgi:hypothetical protein
MLRTCVFFPAPFHWRVSRDSAPFTLACGAPRAQGFWAAFMQDVDTLARVHPYVVPPNAHQGCEWLYCGLIGSVLGVCCLNPDGGDYGQWTVLVEQALDKWRGPFAQRGCSLSLQNHR